MSWDQPKDDSLPFSLCLVALIYGCAIMGGTVADLWPKPLVRIETPKEEAEAEAYLTLLSSAARDRESSLFEPPPPDLTEPPLPALLPDPEADRMTRFGKAGGTGEASQDAPGDRLQLSRLADLEQAMLSRDAEGPGPRADRPDHTTTNPGTGARRPQMTPADLARLLEPSAPERPFGVSPPPTAPTVLARVPVPPADIAKPPLPTPIEKRPIIAIKELPGVTPRESEKPASRPSDQAVAKTQDSPHPSAQAQLDGSPSTRPAVVYAQNLPETRPARNLQGEAAALPTTRPNPMLLPGADPTAEASEHHDKARPATRRAEGIALADSKAIRPDLPDGPLNTDAKPSPKSEEKRPGEQTVGQPARSSPSGVPGNPAEAADPAPKSESESDAFSKTGSVEIRAGRVEARLGREVKTVAPRVRLKGEIDAGTSLFRPVLVASVKIEEDGSVSDVSVLRSTGSRELDLPTTLALYQWRFEPRRDASGKAVSDAMVITVRFY